MTTPAKQSIPHATWTTLPGTGYEIRQDSGSSILVEVDEAGKITVHADGPIEFRAGWRVEPPIEHTRIPTGHVMTDKLRERICQWVRDNDLDPSDIPIDADIQIGEDTITTDVMVRGEDGKAIVSDHRVLRERITVPLRTPWPPA